MFDFLDEAPNNKNNNNLYIIRNKHRNIIFISPMTFNNNIFNEGNIEAFYDNLYDQNHERFEILKELIDLDEPKANKYYFTQNALLPVSCHLMTFLSNRSRYYLEHYYLIEDIDPLTGLPTRSTLKLNFEDRIQNNNKLALMFIDFDNFEAYNQTIGYIKADFILQRVAQLMKSHFTSNEVYRYGGDEFIILLKEEKDFSRIIKELEDKTKNNKSYTINFAIAYGGRQEILAAVKKLIKEGKEITEENFQKCLWLSDCPDLIIRTGGEFRTSNFLPWQSVYSEWIFLEKMWPEFTKKDLEYALEEFEKRQRRFGK